VEYALVDVMSMKTKANLACKEQAAYRGSKLFQMFCARTTLGLI